MVAEIKYRKSQVYNLLSFAVEDALFAILPPELIRQRTVEALKTLVVAEACQQALVVILEDVHWIDKTTEEVVGGTPWPRSHCSSS